MASKRARGFVDEITRLEDRSFSLGEMENPPCFRCGYNGPGYFQESTHPCAKRHHELMKKDESTK